MLILSIGINTLKHKIKAMKNLAKIGKILGEVSIESLPKENLELVKRTLDDYPEIAASLDNPLLAIFQVYKMQVKKKQVDAELEGVIMAAAGVATMQRRDRTSTPVLETTRKFRSRQFEDGRLSTTNLEELLKPAIQSEKSLKDKAAAMLEAIVAMKKERIETLSAYSRDHAAAYWEVVSLQIKDVERRLTDAVRITDNAVRTERIEGILDETTMKAGRIIEGKRQLDAWVRNKTVGVVEQFFPDGVDGKQVLINNKSLRVYAVESPAEPDFFRAYSLLTRTFATNELDGYTMTMDAIKEMAAGKVYSGAWKYDSQSGQVVRTNDLEYNRFISIYIKNNRGEIVGAFDGSFLANKEMNVLYGSHLAITDESQRSKIATMLLVAAYSLCDKYAKEAEKSEKDGGIGAKFQEVNGRKFMGMIGEVEFMGAKESDIVSTWGRMEFFARSGCLMTHPGVIAYLQPDTEVDPKKKFDAAQYAKPDVPYSEDLHSPLPLLNMMRLMRGRIFETTEDFSNPTKILEYNEYAGKATALLYNFFIRGGMNEGENLADLAYALRNLEANKHIAPVRLKFEKPDDFLKVLAQMSGVNDPDQGHCLAILERYFTHQNVTKEERRSSERVLKAKDALAYYLANKTRDPTPSTM